MTVEHPDWAAGQHDLEAHQCPPLGGREGVGVRQDYRRIGGQGGEIRGELWHVAQVVQRPKPGGADFGVLVVGCLVAGEAPVPGRAIHGGLQQPRHLDTRLGVVEVDRIALALGQRPVVFGEIQAVLAPVVYESDSAVGACMAAFYLTAWTSPEVSCRYAKPTSASRVSEPLSRGTTKRFCPADAHRCDGAF